MKKFQLVAVVAAATSLMAAWGAGPAAASPAANAQSQLMAGYEISGASVKMVSTRFTLPYVNCPQFTDTFSGFFVALSKTGLAALDPSHPPRKDALAGVTMQCSPSGLTYTPALLINREAAASPGVTLSAGDTVALSARQTASNAVTTITDLTTGQSAVFDGTAGSNGSRDVAADIVALGEGPVPPFGRVVFTHNEVNGTDVSGLSPVAYDYFDGTTVTMQAGPYNTAHSRFQVTSLTS